MRLYGRLAGKRCKATKYYRSNPRCANTTITPPQLNIHPLIINLAELKTIVYKELKGNGFPPDYITEAKIKVQFLNPKTHSQTIYCFPVVIDKEGHIYEPGRIIEDALGKPFDAFDEKNTNPVKRPQSFFDKLKTLIR